MNETVSVDQAIARGRRMLNYPVIGIIFGVSLLSILLQTQRILPSWTVFAGFGLSLVLAWLWWHVMGTKWKIWAFENVRNVHELKKRAIRERLLWPDDSLFANTIPHSRIDREKWAFLQEKFKREDIFHDDPTIPNETIITYARGKNFAEMLLMLGVAALGVYLTAKTDRYVVGPMAILAGTIIAFKEYRQATNREPQIILNEKGIRLFSNRFYDWNEIQNEEVVSERAGKYTRHYYLRFYHRQGSISLKIDNYNTDKERLNSLLILYKGRSRKAPQR